MSLLVKLKTFFFESMRVLKVTRKPDKIEFKTIVKVTALGILVIGFMGFLLATILVPLRKAVINV